MLSSSKKEITTIKKIMKKLIILAIAILTLSSYTEENCTKTIDTFNGTQEIEVPCEFAD